jgi:hypothetical protein
MQAIGIVLLSVLAAIVYGIVHDQVTARICVEYFTIGHPPVFDTDSPTLLGLGWGVIATWWVGLILGVPLAITARAGRYPKRPVAQLVRPIGVLLACMAVTALLAGLTGHVLARRGAIVLNWPLAHLVPEEKHVPFLTDLWAHSASYLAGFIGGIVLIVVTWRSRRPRIV